MLRLTLAVSIFGVAVGAVSTAAWFQINNSVAPTQTAATKELQTNATVYQENAHANDDTYQTSPINDYAGTLSYDHAQGGTATNYYIREYNSSGTEVHTTQMYTNTGNQTDKAVIFNYSFTTANTYCFKVYNAADDTYLGHDSLVCDSSIASHFVARTAGEVDDNIKTGESGNYYDIYVDKDSHIYIKVHGEVTTSDEMGNETGWYICGNDSSDSNSSMDGMDGTVTTGISMYVNAAKANEGSEDVAYYAGLRVSPGDTFWIMSGDDLETHYYVNEEGSSNLFTYEDGVITAGENALGYYTIALNHSKKIYINPWDGMEVNGSTRYTVNSMADQSNQKQGVERKARRNTTTTGTGSKTATQLYAIDRTNGSTGNKFQVFQLSSLSFSSGYTHTHFQSFITSYLTGRNGGTAVNCSSTSQTRPGGGTTINNSYWWARNGTTSYYIQVKTQSDYGYNGNNYSACYIELPEWVTAVSFRIYGNNWWNSAGSGVVGDAGDATVYGLHSSWGIGKVIKYFITEGWGYEVKNNSHGNVSSNNDFTDFTKDWGSATISKKGYCGSTNLGSVGSETVSKYYIYDTPTSPNSKTGYTFSGNWYKETSLTNLIGTLFITGNTTIYPKYTANQYIITYKDQGNVTYSGNNSDSLVAKHTYGTATTLVAGTKTGYTFVGWYTNSACTEQSGITVVGGNQTVGATAKTAAFTLYAKWTPKTYTVSLNQQGGDGGVSSVSGVTFNADMPAIAVGNLPTKDNYDFVGYYSGTGGTGTKYYNADGTSAHEWDVDGTGPLYAHWAVTYTVSFTKNNTSPYSSSYGNLSGTSISRIPNNSKVTAVTSTSSGGSITINGNTITATPITTTTQYQYTFIGWKWSDTVNAVAVNDTITSDRTIIATFARATRSYTITWNDYNGTQLKQETLEFGATPSYGSTPSRAEDSGHTYTFTGWSPAITTVSGNQTYTATYNAIPKTFTVTLNTNGGTINAGDVTGYTYGVGATLPTNITKDGGYTFAGWYANSSFTDSRVYSISTTAYGDKTYYAKWDRAEGYYVIGTGVNGSTGDFDIMEGVYSGGSDTNNAAKFEGVTLSASAKWKIAYYHPDTGNKDWQNNGFTSGTTHYGNSWAEAYASNNILCNTAGTYKIYLVKTDSYKVSVNMDVAVTYYEKKDDNVSASQTATGNTDIYLSETLSGKFGAYAGYRIEGYYSNSACTSSMNLANLRPTPAANKTVYALYELLPAGYLAGSFNDYDTDDPNYRLTVDPLSDTRIINTSITLYKGSEFKLVYDGNWYGFDNLNASSSAISNSHMTRNGATGDCNIYVAISGVYSFSVVVGSLGSSGAISISDVTIASYTWTTKKVVDGVTTTIETSSDVYLSGESFTVPSLPGKLFGYDSPRGWYISSSGTGVADYTAGSNSSFDSGNITLYAIYDNASTYTYYFDIYSIKDANTLTNGIKVHAWATGASGSGDYTATKVDNSFNYYWTVTVPYSSDLKMQVYRGDAGHSNKQSDAAKISASSTNGDIYILTAWTEGTNSDGTQTGSWLGRCSNGTIQSVTLYKRVASTNTSLHTFYALNQEQWTLSSDVINTYYVGITGYNTPTEFHEGSYNGATTRTAGYSWALTSNVSFYGVYSLITYTFRIRQSTAINGNSYDTATNGTATYTVEDPSTVSFTGVPLGQGKIWYIDDNTGGSFEGHTVYGDLSLTNDKIGISITNVSTTAGNRSVYFGEQSTNIRTLIGGTYTITITIDKNNWTNTSISAITLTAIDTTDFKILGKGGAFNNTNFNVNDAFTATSATANGTTIDYNFGSKHLFIRDQFKAGKVYQSGTDGHTLVNSYSGDTTHFYLNTSDENNITSKLDTNVTITVRFTLSDGTFAIVFSSYTETVHTSINFKHARDAGIYIEITSTLNNGNPDWTASTTRMMHTTSNATYTAQEAPITLTNGQYFRIFRTHSNTTAANNTLTTDTAIRAATEAYYYTLANTPTGFSQGGSYISTAAAAALHRWTISLVASNNTVHIDEYTGASTQSTEHHVPYYLVGRGVPGSDIRGCDYTIDKGIQLYTWGNNVSNMGCYVGAYGTNTSPSNYKGTGINLKAGDVFKFTTASNLITYSQTTHDDSYYTLTAAGQVTIKTSGLYRVYLTGGEGTEVINIEYVSAGDSWSRSGNIVAQRKTGASLIGVNGNVLTFGGNLDYSLLDAYGTDGYTFVIQLYHKTTSAGKITYTITNNNSYTIQVDRKTKSYASAGDYTVGKTYSPSTTLALFTTNITTTRYTCLKITIPAEQAQSMISSGTFSFSMTLEYTFVETTIS